MSERPTTEKAPTSESTPSAGREGRGVVDPAWEQVLLRGREADDADAVGSIDPELTTLHLLRHVREPEPFTQAQLDATWADIDHAIAPAKQPFWGSAWFKWLVPAGAAAALAFIVVGGPGAGEAGPELAYADAPAAADERQVAAPPAAPTRSEAQAAPGELAEVPATEKLARNAAVDETASSTSALLEQQFKMLEPTARAQVGASVDTQRGSMRAALIAQARGGGQ